MRWPLLLPVLLLAACPKADDAPTDDTDTDPVETDTDDTDVADTDDTDEPPPPPAGPDLHYTITRSGNDVVADRTVAPEAQTGFTCGTHGEGFLWEVRFDESGVIRVALPWFEAPGWEGTLAWGGSAELGPVTLRMRPPGAGADQLFNLEGCVADVEAPDGPTGEISFTLSCEGEWYWFDDDLLTNTVVEVTGAFDAAEDCTPWTSAMTRCEAETVDPTPPTCTTIPLDACADFEGCSDAGACVNQTPATCRAEGDESGCEDIDGCRWFGMLIGCQVADGDAECDAGHGDAEACAAIDGCVLDETTCGGETTCDQYSVDEPACRAAEGCQPSFAP